MRWTIDTEDIEVGSVTDFEVQPSELREFFAVSDLQITYLGGYDMDSLESLTGTVIITYEGLTQQIEQPFVISQEKVWIDSTVN